MEVLVPLLVGLLCAVAILVVLRIYLLCWWCRRHRSTSAAASQPQPTPTGGLDADAVAVTLYDPPGDAHDDEQEALCSICLGALVAGDKVKVLPPCGHCFHHGCILAPVPPQLPALPLPPQSSPPSPPTDDDA